MNVSIDEADLLRLLSELKHWRERVTELQAHATEQLMVIRELRAREHEWTVSVAEESEEPNVAAVAVLKTQPPEPADPPGA